MADLPRTPRGWHSHGEIGKIFPPPHFTLYEPKEIVHICIEFEERMGNLGSTCNNEITKELRN